MTLRQSLRFYIKLAFVHPYDGHAGIGGKAYRPFGNGGPFHTVKRHAPIQIAAFKTAEDDCGLTPHPLVRVTPVYYGYFRNNDPRDRMLAIVNYNNDLAEYWEFSDSGLWPIDLSNEAYKLGVNYMIYGVTH